MLSVSTASEITEITNVGPQKRFGLSNTEGLDGDSEVCLISCLASVLQRSVSSGSEIWRGEEKLWGK